MPHLRQMVRKMCIALKVDPSSTDILQELRTKYGPHDVGKPTVGVPLFHNLPPHPRFQHIYRSALPQKARKFHEFEAQIQNPFINGCWNLRRSDAYIKAKVILPALARLISDLSQDLEEVLSQMPRRFPRAYAHERQESLRRPVAQKPRVPIGWTASVEEASRKTRGDNGQLKIN
jgi:hypothetical protein